VGFYNFDDDSTLTATPADIHKQLTFPRPMMPYGGLEDATHCLIYLYFALDPSAVDRHLKGISLWHLEVLMISRSGVIFLMWFTRNEHWHPGTIQTTAKFGDAMPVLESKPSSNASSSKRSSAVVNPSTAMILFVQWFIIFTTDCGLAHLDLNP
jgi:hypothetical protein